MRPTMEGAIEVADRIRALQGTRPDVRAFSEHVARLIERSEEAGPLEGTVEAAPLTVTLGPDGAWIAGPDGVRQRLERAQRRIVLALVERHGAAPGSPITRHDLLAAGWPGEDPIYEAGANRVYVTLNRLRALGLRDVIERFDDGYRLAPRVVVRANAPGA